ncbi:hypothetical protein BP5796_06487 [Coleophoma crateriformis]|uniref:Uncharacterized protein n=1 Tax=Coleophoma crateriformis TaxID=565419 RepID=A0A3D8RNY9_9HELO|nr:hypothetical protein BP5796_06487 [Coleophoma crateriformis]
MRQRFSDLVPLESCGIKTNGVGWNVENEDDGQECRYRAPETNGNFQAGRSKLMKPTAYPMSAPRDICNTICGKLYSILERLYLSLVEHACEKAKQVLTPPSKKPSQSLDTTRPLKSFAAVIKSSTIL